GNRGLDLAERLLIHMLERDIVLDRTSGQGLHALQFWRGGRDQQFAACFEGDGILPAKGFRGFRACPAQLRLQRTRLVIDSGMNDAAIVSRLVTREIAFLLQQTDPRARLGFLHGFCCREPDNAAADDAVIIVCHEVPSSCLFRRKRPAFLLPDRTITCYLYDCSLGCSTAKWHSLPN